MSFYNSDPPPPPPDDRGYGGQQPPPGGQNAGGGQEQPPGYPYDAPYTQPYQPPPYGAPPQHDPYRQHPPNPYAPVPGFQGGYAPQPAKSGQSRFGWIGIVLALASYLLTAGFLFLLVPYVQQGITQPNPEDPQIITAGLIMLGAMALNLLGLVLSFVGFVEKDRGVITVVLGIVLNGFPCLACLFLILLGSVIGG